MGRSQAQARDFKQTYCFSDLYQVYIYSALTIILDIVMTAGVFIVILDNFIFSITALQRPSSISRCAYLKSVVLFSVFSLW